MPADDLATLGARASAGMVLISITGILRLHHQIWLTNMEFNMGLAYDMGSSQNTYLSLLKYHESYSFARWVKTLLIKFSWFLPTMMSIK